MGDTRDMYGNTVAEVEAFARERPWTVFRNNEQNELTFRLFATEAKANEAVKQDGGHVLPTSLPEASLVLAYEKTKRGVVVTPPEVIGPAVPPITSTEPALPPTDADALLSSQRPTGPAGCAEPAGNPLPLGFTGPTGCASSTGCTGPTGCSPTQYWLVSLEHDLSRERALSEATENALTVVFGAVGYLLHPPIGALLFLVPIVTRFVVRRLFFGG